MLQFYNTREDCDIKQYLMSSHNSIMYKHDFLIDDKSHETEIDWVIQYLSAGF